MGKITPRTIVPTNQVPDSSNLSFTFLTRSRSCAAFMDCSKKLTSQSLVNKYSLLRNQVGEKALKPKGFTTMIDILFGGSNYYRAPTFRKIMLHEFTKPKSWLLNATFQSTSCFVTVTKQLFYIWCVVQRENVSICKICKGRFSLMKTRQTIGAASD